MTTFHDFIPENCIGRKVKWVGINHWTGENIIREGTVARADESCLYLDNGCYCLMKDLELGDARIQWLP